MVKIWKWIKLLNSVKFIKKTLVNHVYIRIWWSWLTFAVLQWMKTNFKISQFSRFLLTSEYAIQVKICKWLKLLNSVRFIKKSVVNQFYIRIWSFWLTFTILQWMKTNFTISQFLCLGRFQNLKIKRFCSIHEENTCKSCLHSNLIIFTTFTVLQWILQNLKNDFGQKLLNSVPFIKKTLVNHVYIQIWSSLLTFTVLQWMKTNFKISQFEDFC